MKRNLIVTILLCGCARTEVDPTTAPVEEWTVEPEPAFVAGGDTDAEPLYRINGAVRLTGGYLIVNAGAGELRLYGDDGRLLRTIGREGSGPGEFLAMRVAGRLPADSVVIADAANSRLAIICEGDRVCDEWALPAAANPIGIAGDHVILGEVVPDLSADGLTYDRHRFFSTDRRGVALDTIHEFDSTPRVVSHVDGRIVSLPVLFSRPASVGLVEGGIAVSDGRDPTITIADFDGEVVTVLQLPVPAIDVSREAFDREVERRLEGADARRRALFEPVYKAMPRPEHRSPVQRILVDRLGLIWVELDGDDSATQAWLVMDASGRTIARATTPADLLVSEIGDDYVVGVWRDEMDVEFVRSYTLVRGGPGGR